MTTKTQVSDIRLWPCSQCNQVEQSAQALSVHMPRSHAIKIEARRYAASSRCEACLMEFHGRYRLVTHLAYRASACIGVLRAVVDPLSVAEADTDGGNRGVHCELLAAGRRITYAETLAEQAEDLFLSLPMGMMAIRLDTLLLST